MTIYQYCTENNNIYSTFPEADLEGACAPPPPPPLKFAKHICYTTLFQQFNKQLFHEWLTRDL